MTSDQDTINLTNTLAKALVDSLINQEVLVWGQDKDLDWVKVDATKGFDPKKVISEVLQTTGLARIVEASQRLLSIHQDISADVRSCHALRRHDVSDEMRSEDRGMAQEMETSFALLEQSLNVALTGLLVSQDHAILAAELTR